MIDPIELQAEYFSNIPLIERNIKASVHLENQDDELIWDSVFQRYMPGKYNYIYHSRNEEGSETSGCTQCLKYKPYLCKKFFICIDSDYRQLSKETEINICNFIFQTYTYSWENHYCHATHLHKNLCEKVSPVPHDFNFQHFLALYSKTVYTPLLVYLYMKKEKKAGFSQKQFTETLALQYREGDLTDNGIKIINRLENKFNAFIPNLITSYKLDMEAISAWYANLGLKENNAYLRIRGHNLYNLIKSIGSKILKDFEYEIMLSEPLWENYEEINSIKNDVNIYQKIK